MLCFLPYWGWAQEVILTQEEEKSFYEAELVVDRAGAIKIKNQKNNIEKQVQPLKKELEIWYNLLHRNPEIGYQEKKTASFLSRTLEGFGWKVIKNIGGGNSLIAEWTGNKVGHTILIRVNMDALPYTDRSNDRNKYDNYKFNLGGRVFSLMHGAGNDAHMSIALGLAKLIARQKGSFGGKIILVFQSGEFSTMLGQAHGSDVLLQSDYFVDNKPDFSIGFQIDPHLGLGEVGFKSGVALPASTAMNVNIYPVQTSKIDFVDNTNTLYGAFAHMIPPIQQIVYEERFLLGTPMRIDFNAINGAPFVDVPAQQIEASAMILTYGEEALCRVQDRLAISIFSAAESMGVIAVPSFYSYSPSFINSSAITEVLLDIEGVVGKAVEIANPKFYFNSFSKYALESKAGGFFMLIGGGKDKVEDQLAGTYAIPSDKFSINKKSLGTALVTIYQLLKLTQKAAMRPLN